MKQKLLNQLLHSLPTLSIPDGLEKRVLAAIHEEQQQIASQQKLQQKLVLAFASLLPLSSAVFFVINLTNNGFHSLLTTILLNYQSLPASEALLALLETIPFGSLTVTLGTSALLCLLRSVQMIKQTKAVNYPLSIAHV